MNKQVTNCRICGDPCCSRKPRATKPLFSEASATLASSSCTDYIFKRLCLRTAIKSEDYLHSSGEKYHLIMTYIYMYLISSIVIVKQQTSVDPF